MEYRKYIIYIHISQNIYNIYNNLFGFAFFIILTGKPTIKKESKLLKFRFLFYYYSFIALLK